MSKRDQIFKRIADARISGGGEVLNGGADYVLTISKMLIKEGFKGDFFIMEAFVDEVMPKASEITPAPRPNAVGAKIGYVINMGKTAGPANAKQLVAGILGMTDQDIDAEESAKPGTFGQTLREVINDDPKMTATGDDGQPHPCAVQPFRGMKVIARTYDKKNQGRDNPANAGKIFTAINWEPVAMDDAQIAARRAELDANAAKAAAA